jgi:hypothetical protein
MYVKAATLKENEKAAHELWRKETQIWGKNIEENYY